MWLNGQRQYDRHLLGFKHKKHTMFEDFARLSIDDSNDIKQ
jgi:hypothetical protein